MTPNGRPAVFLDRDGTITRERGHINRPEDLELVDGAAAAVRALNDAGVLAVVISNQSGVARGLITEEELARIHDELERMLAEEGARLDGAYYCPNFAGGTVERYTVDTSCRKPEPGMIERACRDLGIDLTTSVMVGDQLTDLELARRVGIPGVVVLTGKGETALRQANGSGAPVAHEAPDLADAVSWSVSWIRGRGMHD